MHNIGISTFKEFCLSRIGLIALNDSTLINMNVLNQLITHQGVDVTKDKNKYKRNKKRQ